MSRTFNVAWLTLRRIVKTWGFGNASFLAELASLPTKFKKKVRYHVYSVESVSNDQVTYDVHTTLNMCSCFMGKTGAPCKHQLSSTITYILVTLFPCNLLCLASNFLNLQQAVHKFKMDGFQVCRKMILHLKKTSLSPQVCLADDLSDHEEPTSGENSIPDLQPSWSLSQQRELQNKFF